MAPKREQPTSPTFNVGGKTVQITPLALVIGLLLLNTPIGDKVWQTMGYQRDTQPGLEKIERRLSTVERKLDELLEDHEAKPKRTAAAQ